MPVYSFGDIVLVRFHPAYGAELRKYRPAVIVKNLSSIDARFVQIAPLTTKSTNTNNYEMIIDHPILEGKSFLLCWYIMTYDISRVIHRLGKLSDPDQARLRKTMVKSPRAHSS